MNNDWLNRKHHNEIEDRFRAEMRKKVKVMLDRAVFDKKLADLQKDIDELGKEMDRLLK